MPEHRTTIQDGGRVVIPAAYRRALNIKPGEDIILRLQDDELHLYPVRQAVSRARRLVRKHVKRKTLVEELLADRRKEAERE